MKKTLGGETGKMKERPRGSGLIFIYLIAQISCWCWFDERGIMLTDQSNLTLMFEWHHMATSAFTSHIKSEILYLGEEVVGEGTSIFLAMGGGGLLGWFLHWIWSCFLFLRDEWLFRRKCQCCHSGFLQFKLPSYLSQLVSEEKLVKVDVHLPITQWAPVLICACVLAWPPDVGWWVYC